MNSLQINPQTIPLKAKLFRGLSDPSRLSILEALREGPQTVGALVTCTGLSQPNTSNHLNCLFDCGLVTRLPRGRHVVYALSDPRVAELLCLAEALLAETAQGVGECARYEVAESERARYEVSQTVLPEGGRARYETGQAAPAKGERR